MATDAQIVKRPLGPFFITVFVSWVLRIAVYPVACDALHKHGHAAELGSLVMTADALGALLSLMCKLTIGIQVGFVMPMPKENYAARSLEIEFDDSSARISGFDSVAITLTQCLREQTSRHDGERPGYQTCRHRDYEQS